MISNLIFFEKSELQMTTRHLPPDRFPGWGASQRLEEPQLGVNLTQMTLSWGYLVGQRARSDSKTTRPVPWGEDRPPVQLLTGLGDRTCLR